MASSQLSADLELPADHLAATLSQPTARDADDRDCDQHFRSVGAGPVTQVGDLTDRRRQSLVNLFETAALLCPHADEPVAGVGRTGTVAVVRKPLWAVPFDLAATEERAPIGADLEGIGGRDDGHVVYHGLDPTQYYEHMAGAFCGTR
ncbi:hypothetical protein ASD81_04205 [Nocardioides sp. Root614]|nr:hypothetical protein ASD81_04205 [Nocardioides sp. Root614]KRA91854.1 hypothetical protein ASD84_04470 [Nocardioides sp. Root682]